MRLEARLGFLSPRVLRPLIWGPGLFTQSQVTFEVDENREEGTLTDLVVTPLPLTPCGSSVFGGAERRAYADSEGTKTWCRVGRGCLCVG